MEERIDRYITGKMSPDEVLQFRKDLNTNEELQKEYELAKELSDAIQRNAIKEGLRQGVARTQYNKLTFHKIVYTLGAAASLALFVSSGLNYIVSENIKESSEVLWAAMEAPSTRSGNNIDELLDQAYKNITAGSINLANDQLDLIEDSINKDSTIAYETQDEAEYHKSILEIQRQDAEWYRVIILMQKGKVTKSKILLKRIVKENGIYAEQAQELLSTKYKL